MCTLVLLRRPGHEWPLILGANRDEMVNRPWQAPGRHWADRPNVVAGLDELAGGSWFGVNDEGVVAAILNRVGTLGPAAGKRSRGELVLDALDHADAVAAAAALSDIDPDAYRPFNLLVADNRDAFWLAHRGDGRIAMVRVTDGLHMLTARELDDPSSPRIQRYRERFKNATAPDPTAGDWQAWQDLLGDTVPGDGEPVDSAMRFARPDGFATVSSALLALAAPGAEVRSIGRFARVAGQPSAWGPLGTP
ncbi:hypothetical protein GCM10011611_46350 [Aliidongia dinghuensis]|uniref:NRDE family protein n=1 Tax=Aliidongia dinghuensis TaxID=1867774 RepID=A0A8J3E401_9PROT|nr:NRDE family protein [Aliidongia dinghuensis]GGF34878.1 hypothetical protein GCM10011611_46350 [Aliidongia dinghuensis]